MIQEEGCIVWTVAGTVVQVFQECDATEALLTAELACAQACKNLPLDWRNPCLSYVDQLGALPRSAPGAVHAWAADACSEHACMQ